MPKSVDSVQIAGPGQGSRPRVDAAGIAFAGSQLQTQLWVNRRTAKLTDAIRLQFEDLADVGIEWVSPLESERFREYQDAPFLQHLGLAEHAGELARFWPSGGPVWDALAIVTCGNSSGVLLVEGKSYPGELFGSGSQAGTKSRERIDAALRRTQHWLGVEPDPARWGGRLYQSANRLAHLYWLNEVVGVQAWLVHLLFVDDPRSPTSAQDWTTAYSHVDVELGLKGPVPRAGHILLEAGSREELVVASSAAA